jgi:DNA topoisomerase IB
LFVSDVHLSGDTVRIGFVGKAGVGNNASFSDPQIAAHLRICSRGGSRFERLWNITGADLRAGLDAVGAQDVKPKDFRSYLASQIACKTTNDGRAKDKRKARKQALENVSSRLGNSTTAVGKSYADPKCVPRASSKSPTRR